MEALVIIGCLLLSAFFSGMEIAYVSANKVYLGVERKQPTLISKVLTRLTENPTQFITAMLVGNSIALVLYGYHMAHAVSRWFSPAITGWHPIWQILLQVAMATAIILITSEFIPKVFFQIYANYLIKLFALPAYIFYRLFYYIGKWITALADFILVKILHTKADIKKAYFTPGELGTYINEQFTAASVQDGVDTEIQIFKNALEFSVRKARDIMTPRTEIAAVEISSDISALRQLFIETGYSKIVVYTKSIDSIVGYVHSFALFKNPETIESVMVPIVQAPETIYIKELLNILTRRHRSMAVVLDEYGGTSGIVTVEDIVEELFGEIEDEHDLDEPAIEEKITENSWLFSSRLDVAYINNTYGLHLPKSASYTTLGGLIMYIAKKVPAKGTSFQYSGYTLTIEAASAHKTELVKITHTAGK